MSDGLKLIASSLEAKNPGPLLRLPGDVWIEGPETRALAYVRVHYTQFHELPSPVTVQENTGVRLPTARDTVEYYTSSLINRRAHNKAREYYADLRKAMEDTSAAGMEALRSAATGILRAVQETDSRGSRLLTMRDIWEQYHDKMMKAIRAGDDYLGVPIGYPAMDRETLGLQESDMVSLIARTGMGKTIILCKQADTAVRMGLRALFVTTEMSALQIGLRVACLSGAFNPEWLKVARLSTYVQRQLEEFLKQDMFENGLMLHEAGFGSNTGELEARVAETRPDIIIVDGAYLLRPSSWSKSMSRFEQVTNASNELKSISLVYKTPLLASYQFNRGAGKGGEDGDLEHVALTDAIVNNSSIVFKLAPGPTDDPQYSRRLASMKGRDGESFDFPINWRFRPTMDISQYYEDDRFGSTRPPENEQDEDADTPEENPVGPETPDYDQGLGV